MRRSTFLSLEFMVILWFDIERKEEGEKSYETL